jgi:hypothetical protein
VAGRLLEPLEVVPQPATVVTVPAGATALIFIRYVRSARLCIVS